MQVCAVKNQIIKMKTITPLVIALLGAMSGNTQISITDPSFSYSQTFTPALIPEGWSFFETGDNADGSFGVSTGSNATGNTYLLGTPSEYCFGGLQSGSVIPTIGVRFVNDMPTRTITSITLQFIAETWRVGTSNRPDGLDFQINVNASDINSEGTWATIPALAYRNPGQQTGFSNVKHSQTFNYTITGLSIPPGAPFSMRWLDLDATGADDAIGIDNFIIAGLTSLPVELLHFSGKKDGASVLLSFATATERDNSHFVIERSGDGRAFEAIGEVRGAGNSQQRHDYTFTDDKPLRGTNYYRLRQVDLDGEENLGPIIQIELDRISQLTLAPSPAFSRVRIHLEEAPSPDARWQVFDNMGNQVLSGLWQTESNEDEIDIDALPKGTYTFYLIADGQVWSKQFSKM